MHEDKQMIFRRELLHDVTSSLMVEDYEWQTFIQNLHFVPTNNQFFRQGGHKYSKAS